MGSFAASTLIRQGSLPVIDSSNGKKIPASVPVSRRHVPGRKKPSGTKTSQDDFSLPALGSYPDKSQKLRQIFLQKEQDENDSGPASNERENSPLRLPRDVELMSDFNSALTSAETVAEVQNVEGRFMELASKLSGESRGRIEGTIRTLARIKLDKLSPRESRHDRMYGKGYRPH